MATRKTIETYAAALIFALATFEPHAKKITSEVVDTVIEGGRVMALRQITMPSPISASGRGK